MPIAVRIEFDGENKIDHRDLQDDQKKSGARATRLLGLAFLAVDVAVNFEDRLGDEEQAAADENNVAPGDLVAQDGDERRTQAPQNRQPKQHGDAKHQRQHQPDLAGPAAGRRLETCREQ